MSEFKLKYVLIANAILGFLFGLMFLFLPDMSGANMGLAACDGDGDPLRFLGAGFISLGVLLLLIRNEPHSQMRQSILLYLVIHNIFAVFLHLFLHDLTNIMVLFVILLCTTWACLYGYFFMKNRGK